MFEKFKQAWLQIKSVRDTQNVMRRLKQVKAYTPVNAQYVTLGDMFVLEGRMQVSGIKYDNALLYHQSIENTQDITTTQAYMLHDGSNLVFIDDASRTLLNTPLTKH